MRPLAPRTSPPGGVLGAPLPRAQAGWASPRLSNLRCSSPCWCQGSSAGAEAGAGRGWGLCGAGWGLRRGVPADPRHQQRSARVPSPALRVARKCNLSPAAGEPIRRSLRRSGRGDRREDHSLSRLSRLFPPPAPTPSPTHFHPVLLHSPASQTQPPSLLRRQTARQMSAGAGRRRPRHPGHKYTHIWAQHPSHSYVENQDLPTSLHLHSIAGVPNVAL